MNYAQAEHLGAFYSTESQFEAELLALSANASKPTPAANSTNFLLANQTVLRVGEPDVIVKFRQINESRIADFQASLFAMSQSLSDSDDFTIAARREFDKTIRPQIEAFDQAWHKLSGQVQGDATLAAIATATVCLGGTSFPVSASLAVLGAVAKSWPTITEYRAKRRGIAFLWQCLT